MPLDQDPHDYNDEKEMSFLDHLEELRWHIVRSVAAIFVFMIVAFYFTDWIFETIVFAPASIDFPTFKWLCKLDEILPQWLGGLCIDKINFKLQSRHMTGQFTMAFTSAFVIGLIVAFPYVFWEIWRFIKPGLYKKERKFSKGAVFYVSFLFLTGVLFGYFVMCPMSVWFFSSFTISDKISNEFDITSYVGTMVALVFGSGFLFQLPMVAYFLSRIGMLTPQFMRQYRRHAAVVIIVVGAIITPPDPLSQMLISLPIYLLYEISIFISAYVQRQKRKEEEAELRQSAT